MATLPSTANRRPTLLPGAGNITPERLLTLALDLYGAASAGVVVTVGVESLEPGTNLSPKVRAAVPHAAAAALTAVASARPGQGRPPPGAALSRRGGRVHA